MTALDNIMITKNKYIKDKDFICNKCGNTCVRYFPSGLLTNKAHPELYGLINAKVSGGYLSDPLEDCTLYTFSLCEMCLYDLFASFKVKIKKEDYC